jgi:hypothetical protein
MLRWLAFQARMSTTLFCARSSAERRIVADHRHAHRAIVAGVMEPNRIIATGPPLENGAIGATR